MEHYLSYVPQSCTSSNDSVALETLARTTHHAHVNGQAVQAARAEPGWACWTNRALAGVGNLESSILGLFDLLLLARGQFERLVRAHNAAKKGFCLPGPPVRQKNSSTLSFMVDFDNSTLVSLLDMVMGLRWWGIILHSVLSVFLAIALLPLFISNYVNPKNSCGTLLSLP